MFRASEEMWRAEKKKKRKQMPKQIRKCVVN